MNLLLTRVSCRKILQLYSGAFILSIFLTQLMHYLSQEVFFFLNIIQFSSNSTKSFRNLQDVEITNFKFILILYL